MLDSLTGFYPVSCVNSPLKDRFIITLDVLIFPNTYNMCNQCLEFILLVLEIAHRQKDGFRESVLTHLSPQMESGDLWQMQPLVAYENSDISNVTSSSTCIFKYGMTQKPEIWAVISCHVIIPWRLYAQVIAAIFGSDNDLSPIRHQALCEPVLV